MKRIVTVLFLAVLLSGCGNSPADDVVGQKRIVSQDAVFGDYLPLLEKAGYKVYSFDISAFQDSMRTFTVDVREYEYGKRTGYRGGYVNFPNMMMLADFTESQQKEILAEGNADDPARGIYRLSEKLTLSFAPGKDDAQTVLYASMQGLGESSWVLPLRPIVSRFERFNGSYAYGHRPFELDTFEEDEFIPLAMYGSFWDDGGIVRFCGERVLPSDMSSDMMKLIPHYYVVGVTVSSEAP